mgnify:CR=1 FL=1
MDTTVTETLRHSLTVSDSDFQLTVLSGAAGPTGPTGPNAITSSTSSDGTATIQANTLTAGTVSATGNISGSAGDFTTLTVGSSNDLTVSSSGNVVATGSITSDGNITATAGDIISSVGAVTAPTILASADPTGSTTARLGYSSGGAATQGTSITTGVTLNAPSGVITCVSHTYSANDSSKFILSNTHIGANDVVVVSLQVGHDKLYASVTATTTGTCSIAVRNGGNGNVTAAVKINFAIIKVATS